MRLFILDLHNAIADFDNNRLTGNDFRDEIAEIIADRLGSLEQDSYIHHVIKKIKVMGKVEEINQLINGYANSLITDDELEFMLNLLGE